MRIIAHILRKEFLQIIRNKQMLPIIFVIPIFQLLVLVHATTFEVKKVDLHLIDMDNTSTSRLLIEKFTATKRFFITGRSYSVNKGFEEIGKSNARMILNIPQNLEKDMMLGNHPKVQMIINAVDGAAAGIIQSYSQQILNDFNITLAQANLDPRMANLMFIDIKEKFWYNSELDYKYYMVPGILCILVTLIGMFLSSMNIVKEKEMGTIEQLNVTPIRKYHFIIGKLLPFWIIALFDLAFGLTIAKLLFDNPIEGNLFLLFGMSSLYLIVVLSIGLLISTITETQQQAMYVAWFSMVLFIMMSGLFTPIDSMPHWAQIVTQFNPIAHFIEIMRRVMLKGAGFNQIIHQFTVLLIYAVVILILAVWRYKKVTS